MSSENTQGEASETRTRYDRQKENYTKTISRLQNLVAEKNRLLHTIYESEVSQRQDDSLSTSNPDFGKYLLQRNKWMNELSRIQKELVQQSTREDLYNKLLIRRDEQMQTCLDEIRELEARNAEYVKKIIELSSKDGQYEKLLDITSSSSPKFTLPATSDENIQDRSIVIEKSMSIITELLRLKSDHINLMEQKLKKLESKSDSKILKMQRFILAAMGILCTFLTWIYCCNSQQYVHSRIPM